MQLLSDMQRRILLDLPQAVSGQEYVVDFLYHFCLPRVIFVFPSSSFRSHTGGCTEC